ncbi:MAG: DNA-binding protein WhiA [Oscillospiraceae bacterium]|jgi:DNA-binding protein WhiA|nr:DNA-binding protein WhiA [Oscillospiraceae bacterium]
MSFSGGVKNEICRVFPSKDCDISAECYGILLYCNTFSSREVRIITENDSLAERIPALFSKSFGLAFDDIRAPESGKRSFIITSPDKLETVFGVYGFSPDETLSHHINRAVLEDSCCCASFLRGAFLAGGSVSDPRKSYHLELATPHAGVAREMPALLRELDFEPKSVSRAGNHVTYFKQSGAIEDFLTLIGASVSAMELMGAKIEKDMRNSVNRRVNCDTANVSKTVDAAQGQLETISLLDLGALPDKLRDTARRRLGNPELSLSELAALHDPPITKSGLSHRLRRLRELASGPGDAGREKSKDA